MGICYLSLNLIRDDLEIFLQLFFANLAKHSSIGCILAVSLLEVVFMDVIFRKVHCARGNKEADRLN
jgi:hypothetical protein